MEKWQTHVAKPFVSACPYSSRMIYQIIHFWKLRLQESVTWAMVNAQALEIESTGLLLG